MSRGISSRGLAGIAPQGNQQPANTALLNSLWGREKIKFGHLRKTKDLAATSTEKDGKIAFLKPNRKSGPPPLARPKGRIDRSFSTQFNSFTRFVLPVAGPAIGKTTLRPGFAVRRDDKGHATNCRLFEG
jgi:hypothetical protein